MVNNEVSTVFTIMTLEGQKQINDYDKALNILVKKQNNNDCISMILYEYFMINMINVKNMLLEYYLGPRVSQISLIY